ncbi:MAG: toll/interleukin-1 receptor domain-containing protein [bacterium]
MKKITQTDTPRVFISHAWEDKPLVRRLETELQAAGAEVWVDHSGIRGGDNLPGRISEALKWCNMLLLVWSEAASKSHWVEIEWTNAIALRKAIIPCRMSTVPLPPILSHLAYVDFRNDINLGIAKLLHGLKLTQPLMAPAATEPVE